MLSPCAPPRLPLAHNDARSPPPLAPDPAAAHPARQDDQGWHNGFNNPALITPHTDALLKEGLKLLHHFVYKFCSPTRSSLLSGRLPVHVNQENSATEQPLAGIPIEMTIWSVVLQKVGCESLLPLRLLALQTASHAASLSFNCFNCDQHTTGSIV